MSYVDLISENQYLKDLLNQDTTEMLFLENQLQETLKPNIISSQIVHIVLQMQIELSEFIQRKGKNSKTSVSENRLKNLLCLVIELNNFSGKLNTLQLINKQLVGKYRNLSKLYAELYSQLENIKKSEEF